MTDKKTIYITRFPFSSQLGGIGIHTLAVAKNYRKNGHQVIFLSSCQVFKKLAQENDFQIQSPWFYKAPVSIKSLIIFTLLSPYLFFKAWLLIKKLPQKKNTVFYMNSFTEKLLFTPFLHLYKIKTIWLEHTRIGRWFTKNPWKPFYKHLAQKTTVITVSHRMVKDLELNKTKVIPNAVSNSFFNKIRDVDLLPSQVKEYFKDKKIHIGFVGRFTEDKGVIPFSKAANNLKEFSFIAVGEGPYQNRLEKSGVKISPLLNRQQIAAFMQTCDIFVLPSTQFDPFGLVALEAMASGTATIISDQCGVGDYLKNNKEALISSSQKLEENIKKLASNEKLREKIAKKGQQIAAEKFSYSEMLKSYNELL